MEGPYAGQSVYYQPIWGNGNMPLPAQEMQRLQHLPPQFIIGEYMAERRRFEEERSAMMEHIKDLQHEKRMHEIHEIQLREEVASLNANREKERVQWQRMISQFKDETATLKQELERGKKDFALKLAQIDKTVASMKEKCEKTYVKTRQQLLVFKSKEESSDVEQEKERKYTEVKAANEKMKKEVAEWKEKFVSASVQLNVLQAKVAELKANFAKALLKSKPRLIDLHYFIVQRLPPASRPYASAFCFILGLSMELSDADDKFQVTATFRRWLQYDSYVPHTWDALLRALQKYFCYEEIPDTWIADITKELVYGGIAALTFPRCFCKRCHQDFTDEYECYEIKDDSEGISKSEEQSGIPQSQEMVAPCHSTM